MGHEHHVMAINTKPPVKMCVGWNLSQTSAFFFPLVLWPKFSFVLIQSLAVTMNNLNSSSMSCYIHTSTFGPRSPGSSSSTLNSSFSAPLRKCLLSLCIAPLDTIQRWPFGSHGLFSNFQKQT